MSVWSSVKVNVTTKGADGVSLGKIVEEELEGEDYTVEYSQYQIKDNLVRYLGVSVVAEGDYACGVLKGLVRKIKRMSPTAQIDAEYNVRELL